MKSVSSSPPVSRCKNPRFLCNWRGQLGAATREGLSTKMAPLRAPIGLQSPILPIGQILVYKSTLWHNRSLSVTPGDRVPPIGLLPLPTHLIAGQSADRSAPRTQQESEMGQVQIYDPPPSNNTPPILPLHLATPALLTKAALDSPTLQ